MSQDVTERALWPGTHVRHRRHEPETGAGDDGRMLTICTRCRIPYDRRQADPAVPSAVAAFCSSCATGAVGEAAPVLATVARIDTGLTVLPRSILPVAS